MRASQKVPTVVLAGRSNSTRQPVIAAGPELAIVYLPS
jgi:hypothetical protein